MARWRLEVFARSHTCRFDLRQALRKITRIVPKTGGFSGNLKKLDIQIKFDINDTQMSEVCNSLKMRGKRISQRFLANSCSDVLISRGEKTSISHPPMKATKFLIGAISLVAAVAAGKADAQNLDTLYTNIIPGLDVQGTVTDGEYTNFRTGVMLFPDFQAFCVQPEERLGFNEPVVYQAQEIGLLTNHVQVSLLVGGYIASLGTDADAAAVQWAIWEVTTEKNILSPRSLVDGNVRISTPLDQATADLANQYLANMNSYKPATLTYLANEGRQDVVTWNLIPEPGSAGLAAFSALLLLRRRRR